MIHTLLPVAGPTAVDGQARLHPAYCLMLALSDRCNLRCTYCFVDKTSRRMTRETARKSIDFFLHPNITGARAEVGLTFFGGEPFLEIDLMEEVVDYLTCLNPRKKIRYTATTNGTLVGPRLERLIRKTQMELLVSLDGGEEASSYRPFENGKSSYALVAKNLKTLVSWASEVIVRMTFHPQALDLVGNLTRAIDLGAPSVVLAPVVEADWSGSEERLEQAYQELADWFIAEAYRGRILPLESTWVLLHQIYAFLNRRGRPARPCDIGTSLLAVDPDGAVMPCHRFLYRPQDWLGTVDSPYLSSARNQYLDIHSSDFLACQDCEAQPVCGGGCRAVTLDSGRGLREVHPGHCLTTRAHARAAYRIYETLEDDPAFVRVLTSSKHLGVAISELALR